MMTGQRAAECFRLFTAAFVFSDKKAEHRLLVVGMAPPAACKSSAVK